MDKGGKKAGSHPELLCTCNCKLIGSGQEERGKGLVSHPETLCTDDIRVGKRGGKRAVYYPKHLHK